MQLTSESRQLKCDPLFRAEIEALSEVNISRCYQCFTCALGCPVAYAMDYRPNQIIRLCQLGLKDAVLGSSTIWICASCESCVTRCPNEIDIPHLMDTLHQVALREGVPPKEPAVPVFHKSFIEPIRRFGRQYEIMMTVLFIFKARKFSFKDLCTNAALGLNMMKRRKLKLTPPLIKNLAAIEEIFEKAESGEQK